MVAVLLRPEYGVYIQRMVYAVLYSYLVNLQTGLLLAVEVLRSRVLAVGGILNARETKRIYLTAMMRDKKKK